ncbi:MAG: hypothetical protein ACPG8C_02560, partial [Parvibaculales bacterium]
GSESNFNRQNRLIHQMVFSHSGVHLGTDAEYKGFGVAEEARRKITHTEAVLIGRLKFSINQAKSAWLITGRTGFAPT